jgi:hypothetical protein
MFIPSRDAPVVELLHPVARDPQTRSLTCRVIRQGGTTRFQVADQILQRLDIPSSPPRARAGPPTLHRPAHATTPERPPTRSPGDARDRGRPGAQALTAALHQVPPADDPRPVAEAQALEPLADPPRTVSASISRRRVPQGTPSTASGAPIWEANSRVVAAARCQQQPAIITTAVRARIGLRCMLALNYIFT